jgi:hypothetical protein
VNSNDKPASALKDKVRHELIEYAINVVYLTADLAALLADPDSYFYVSGLRSMDEGVVLALRDIAEPAGPGKRWAPT